MIRRILHRIRRPRRPLTLEQRLAEYERRSQQYAERIRRRDPLP